MNIVLFLLVGIIAGWVAGEITRDYGFGLLGNLVVGVIGAFVGGWLFDVLGIGIGAGILGTLVTATVGAITFLFIVGLIASAFNNERYAT